MTMRMSTLIRRLEDVIISIVRGGDRKRDDERRIERLRTLGVRIGKNCLIYTTNFSTEPYLIEIGDHVGIAAGTHFVTHEPSVWLAREKYPDAHILGKIKVGNNTIIGMNCIILPNTTIGNNCIVGAASVVRGAIPDNSIVYGNPARVIGKANLLVRLLLKNKNRLDTRNMPPEERERVIKKHFHIT
jgi:acetyltransferase-like isoleucine patch superfamily enzyme